jgi:AraC-like DNA-binding protein
LDKLIFNINDQALILIIVACFLHGFTIYAQHKPQNYQLILCFFLGSLALSALDELMFWSFKIKSELLGIFSVDVFFILKFSFFLSGPFLYFFCKSIIYSNFKISSSQLLHFLPAIIALLLYPALRYSLGEENIKIGLFDYSVLFNDSVFKVFAWGSKISCLAYAFAAYIIVNRHKFELEKILSSTDGIAGEWLKLLVAGFLFIWLFKVSTEVLHQFNFLVSYENALGLAKNYLEFLLINILVFLSITKALNVHQQVIEKRDEPQQLNYTDEQVSRLHDAMEIRKIFLDPNLSLDQLSQTTSLPQRTLSTILNKHFNMNFNEFVNSYRTEHAIKLLSENKPRITMLEIMSQSGFNSKSAFNKFFKHKTGLTPSEFKKIKLLDQLKMES